MWIEPSEPGLCTEMVRCRLSCDREARKNAKAGLLPQEAVKHAQRNRERPLDAARVSGSKLSRPGCCRHALHKGCRRTGAGVSPKAKDRSKQKRPGSDERHSGRRKPAFEQPASDGRGRRTNFQVSLLFRTQAASPGRVVARGD